jgi:polyisoprenoid-binding protein YceI
MKYFKLIAITFLLSSSLFAGAKNKKGVKISVNLSPAGSFQIEFKSIKGSVKKVGGRLMAKKLTVKSGKLKTGLDLRDKHTKDKLGYKNFPKVVVTDAVSSGGKGTATLTIRGVSKKIKFTVKEAGRFAKILFDISLKDFKFKGINYMGVGVKDKVKVQATVPIGKK